MESSASKWPSASEIRFSSVNPKRMKTLAYARYAKYCIASTKAESLQLGATAKDLLCDFRLGALTLLSLGISSEHAVVGGQPRRAYQVSGQKPPKQKTPPPPKQKTPPPPKQKTQPSQKTISEKPEIPRWPQTPTPKRRRISTKASPFEPQSGHGGDAAVNSLQEKPEIASGGFALWSQNHIRICSATIAEELGWAIALRFASSALAFVWKLESVIKPPFHDTQHNVVLAAVLLTALSHEIAYLVVG